MKILSAMQWRLLGYLRKYLFPYVLLLGMAMLVLSAATAAVPILIRFVGDLGTNPGGAFSIFGDGTQLISLLATAFYLDWQLAIVAFIGFPIIVVPIISLSKKVRRETKNAQKQMSGLQSLLHETFQGNRVVKAFGME